LTEEEGLHIMTRPEIGCLQNNQKWISKHRLFSSNLETGVGYRKLAAKYGIPPLLVFFTTFNLVYWHLFTV